MAAKRDPKTGKFVSESEGIPWKPLAIGTAVFALLGILVLNVMACAAMLRMEQRQAETHDLFRVGVERYLSR